MGFLRNEILQRVKPIHRKMREQKIELFLHLVGGPGDRTTLLDVGGGAGITGEFLRLYSSFATVVIVNLHASPLENPHGASIKSIKGDGCALPFKSRSFDWVFSNAVIEHVGDVDRRRRFAEEIRRVAARGYFVATPNRYFPIEPHTFLPFYQFLPSVIQRRYVRLALGYVREPHEIHLFSRGDLQLLFPEACVRKVGLRLFATSLVAMHKVDEISQLNFRK